MLPALPPDLHVTLPSVWVQDYPAGGSSWHRCCRARLPMAGRPCRARGSPFFNLSNFCNPAIDRRMQRGLDLQLTDPHASARAWEELDHDLVDLAPMVPYSTGIRVWLVSERASNVEVSPQLDVLVSQIWVG